jgi:predicted MFS family arabinose efflux permease
MLLATIVAVRQALDYRSTARAVGVCVLGWVLAIAIAAALGLLFGPSVS